MAGPAVSFRLFTIIAIVVAVLFTAGLGHVNFRDRNYYTLLLGTLSHYTVETTMSKEHEKPNTITAKRRNTSGAQTPQNIPFPLRYLATDAAERQKGDWDIHPEGPRKSQVKEDKELPNNLRDSDYFDHKEDHEDTMKVFM